MVRRALVLGAAILIGSSCRTRLADGPGSMGPTQVTVLARNLHPDHVTLYYYRNASKRRLGSVLGGREERFTISWPSSAPLLFEVDMLDGERCATPSFTVLPGDHVVVWLRFDARAGVRLCDFRVEDGRRSTP